MTHLSVPLCHALGQAVTLSFCIERPQATVKRIDPESDQIVQLACRVSYTFDENCFLCNDEANRYSMALMKSSK
jgi:hypothetical protein